MLKSLLKWDGYRADPVNGFIQEAFADAARWSSMTRRARKYRHLTWVFCGAMLAAVVLAGVVWAFGSPTLVAVAQGGVVLATVGVFTCIILMRRGARSDHPADFGVGIAGYPLKDLEDYHRGA
jgi:hypothetical protein